MGLVFSVMRLMAAADGDATKVKLAMRGLLRKSIFLGVIYLLSVVVALANPTSHASAFAGWDQKVWTYYALTGAIALLMALDTGLLCWAISEFSPRAIGAAGLAQLLTAIVYLAKEVHLVIYYLSVGVDIGGHTMMMVMIGIAALVVVGKFLNAAALFMIWKRVNGGDLVLVEVQGARMIQVVDPPRP